MYQQDLLRYYLAALEFNGPVESFEFSFAQHDARRAAVVKITRMALPCSDGSNLWFVGTLGARDLNYSLACDHEHAFVGIFDSGELALCEVLASSYHYDRFVARLGYGHTFPLGPASVVRGKGYSSALVLDATVYQHFRENDALVAGIPTHLSSVVPVGDSELQVKQASGLDALLAQWDRGRRDILHV